MKFNAKQQKFCDEYLKDFNGRRSAIASGYSKKTADVQASKLLSYGKVKEYIDKHRAKSSDRVEAQVKSILDELLNYVNSDITQTVGLSPQQVKELPIELRRMVSSFKHIKTGKMEIIELKFYDKMKALEMINKHIGLYEVDNKQKATIITVIPPKKNESLN